MFQKKKRKFTKAPCEFPNKSGSAPSLQGRICLGWICPKFDGRDEWRFVTQLSESSNRMIPGDRIERERKRDKAE